MTTFLKRDLKSRRLRDRLLLQGLMSLYSDRPNCLADLARLNRCDESREKRYEGWDKLENYDAYFGRRDSTIRQEGPTLEGA